MHYLWEAGGESINKGEKRILLIARTSLSREQGKGHTCNIVGTNKRGAL